MQKNIIWLEMQIKLYYEFAGADADYYHKLSRNAEQLEQGHRCGRTINALCKKIIRPIWEHLWL